MRVRRLTAAVSSILAAASLAPSAEGAISLQIQPNFDNTRTTEYPNGDKPDAGCVINPGWTLLAKGTAAGEICDVAGDFQITASGSDDENDQLIAYQDCGSVNCQVIARIPIAWTGHSETFTGFGVGISGLGDTDFFAHAWVTPTGVPRCKVDQGSGSDEYNASSPSGAALPEYLAVTNHDAGNEIRCLQSDDGITWVTYGTFSIELAEPTFGYLWGTSHDVALTSTAVLENGEVSTTIDTYTPVDPGGGAPVLLNAIPNQNLVVGTPFSLSCSGNWSGTVTSYNASGLPGGSGLSFNNSTCQFTGTPDADDLAATPITPEVCAFNGAASSCTTPQFDVSIVPGDTFQIAAGVTAVNCADHPSGGAVTPIDDGDIIELAAGVRTNQLTISNCNGTLDNPIVVKNSPDGQTIFEDGNESGSQFFFTITNSFGMMIDGTQAWTGKPAGSCGISKTLAWPTEGRTQCGIKMRIEAGGDPFYTTWLKFKGDTSGITVKGVEIDGTGGTGAGGIGISCNDNAEAYSPTGRQWRENIIITQNYIHNTGISSGEGLYCGPNAEVGVEIPLRNIEVSYNLVEDTAREGINGKYWVGGVNSVHHNVVRRSGAANSTNQNRNINITDGGNVDIYSNLSENARGEGIQHVNNGVDASDTPTACGSACDGPFYSRIYNNFIVNAGASSADAEPAIEVNKGGGSINYSPIVIEFNTIINPDGDGIRVSGWTGTCTARDNIVTQGVAAGDGQTMITGCTNDGNTTGTVNSQLFIDAGIIDYELGVTSPACNAATFTSQSLDYEDEARPQDGVRDRGADENTACP